VFLKQKLNLTKNLSMKIALFLLLTAFSIGWSAECDSKCSTEFVKCHGFAAGKGSSATEAYDSCLKDLEA
jgi:hypothetical protein